MGVYTYLQALQQGTGACASTHTHNNLSLSLSHTHTFSFSHAHPHPQSLSYIHTQSSHSNDDQNTDNCQRVRSVIEFQHLANHTVSPEDSQTQTQANAYFKTAHM